MCTPSWYHLWWLQVIVNTDPASLALLCVSETLMHWICIFKVILTILITFVCSKLLMRYIKCMCTQFLFIVYLEIMQDLCSNVVDKNIIISWHERNLYNTNCIYVYISLIFYGYLPIYAIYNGCLWFCWGPSCSFTIKHTRYQSHSDGYWLDINVKMSDWCLIDAYLWTLVTCNV